MATKPAFQSLGLLKTICDSVTSLGIATPTPVQTLAIPSLLQSKSHHLIAAQTGTGKTMAYLLPLLHRIKTREAEAGQRLTRPNSPRALIIVPTRELSTQLALILTAFKHTVRFKTFSIHSGVTPKVLNKELNEGLDLLVGTPEHVRRCRDWGVLRLDCVESVVFDESDTMVDAGMSGILHEYVDKVRNARFVFVGATHPKQLESALTAKFDFNPKGKLPYIKKIVAPNTHLNLANIRHELISLTGYDKNPQFLALLKSNQHKIEKSGCIVFCNTIKSARSTDHLLNEQGYNAVSLHGEVPTEQRARNVERFRMGLAKILVCTDLGSRGLDFPEVELVLQYDFPSTISDYLHRVGRTGRGGRLGVAVSLYRRKDQEVVDQLQESFQSKRPLKVTNSAYSYKNKEDQGKQK